MVLKQNFSVNPYSQSTSNHHGHSQSNVLHNILVPQHPENTLSFAHKKNTSFVGVKVARSPKKRQNPEYLRVSDRIEKLSTQIRDLRGEIKNWENSQQDVRICLGSEFGNPNQESVKKFDEKIHEVEGHIQKLEEFKNSHLVNYISSLKVRISQIDEQINYLQPYTQSELDQLQELKKDFQMRWTQAQEQYNQALEGKAMISEDFKGKLVERAELVAEQED